MSISFTISLYLYKKNKVDYLFSRKKDSILDGGFWKG